MLLREHRHELLDADLQHTLANSLARSLDTWKRDCWPSPHSCTSVTSRPGRRRADRDGQALADGTGLPRCRASPFSQGTLFNFRMRLITHNLDKTLLDRTVALAEHTAASLPGNCARVLDSTPLFGAWPGRRHVEPARPCAAQGGAWRPADWTRPAGIVRTQGDDARWDTAVSAALDLIGGAQRTLPRAGLGPGEVERWQRWLEQQHPWRLRHLSSAGGHGDHHAAYHAGHRARPGVDWAGDASSSTSHLTGASLSRINTCATVAKAVPKPSTVFKSTLPWIWIAPHPGGGGPLRRMSRA